MDGCKKELAARLGVTVGIIGCNWGGTSASCWVDKDSLERDKDLSTYLSEYETAILGKSEEQQIAEYTEYEEFRKIWEPKCNKLYEERPDIGWDEINEILGDSRYPGPLNCANPYRPTGLYNTMIKRIAPYTLKGVIYYQGESDDHKPRFYEKLLTNLISCWRTTFKDLELPFLFVQLPIHRYKQDPDFKNWCLIREAQMNIYKTIKNTGIAVALDCGIGKQRADDLRVFPRVTGFLAQLPDGGGGRGFARHIHDPAGNFQFHRVGAVPVLFHQHDLLIRRQGDNIHPIHRVQHIKFVLPAGPGRLFQVFADLEDLEVAQQGGIELGPGFDHVKIRRGTNRVIICDRRQRPVRSY